MKPQAAGLIRGVPAMSFVLITPVKNEEACIEETLKSVVSQTMRPAEWIIVSDNSTDTTEDIIRPYAEEHAFIRLVQNTDREKRDMASRIFAIKFGIKDLKHDSYTFIGILDGDIRLDPDYYERIHRKFTEDEELGLAGGALYEKMGDLFVDQKINENSVAGGVQLFRRECYEAIGGLTPLPRGGTDSVAEVMVRMHGWRTRTFSDIPFFHLRPVNAATGSFFYGKRQLGERDYLIGNHFLFELFRCAFRVFERPYVIASLIRLVGFMGLWIRKSERSIPAPVVRFKQAEQLKRLKSMFIR
jgi:biofilm PGA synthesis N-glycosyltransferase PgaC